MNYYYANETSEAVGPCTEEQMRELRAQGVLHDNSWVIAGGAAEWQTFRSAFPPAVDAGSPAGGGPPGQDNAESPSPPMPAPVPATSCGIELNLQGILYLLFSFKGRIGRGAFWLGFTPVLSLCFFWGALEGVGDLVWGTGRAPEAYDSVLLLLLGLPTCWIGAATQWKRWHDLGHAGWCLLINLIPLLGILASWIYLGFIKGAAGANKYGEDPLLNRANTVPGTAIISMTLGISSLILGPFAGIPAIICGHAARTAIGQSNGALKGSAPALAGLVLGYFFTILFIFGFVMFFI